MERARNGSGWYVVGLLSLLYGLSIVDRFALALLAEPIIDAFALSASQMGLLLGVGFALLYSVTGLPLAHLLDRSVRKYVLAAGVAIWSLCTILSAFSQDFLQLLICRSGVAIGEAVLTPAAISLIADLFDQDRRRLPISVYSSVSSFMVTGSFILGAAALQVATSWSPSIGMAPWRITLLIVGAPGLVMALIFLLTVREPARHHDAGPLAQGGSTADLIAYLRANWRFYLPFYLALGSMSALLFAILSWSATLLAREHGYGTADAGYMFGLIGIGTGLVGTFLWPAIAARIDRKGRGDGLLHMILTCVVIGSLGSFLAMTVGSRLMLFVGLGLAMATFPPINTALSSLLIQGCGPAAIRARLIAINILVMNLMGYTIGPQFVGAYIDVPGNQISDAIALLAAVAGPVAAISLLVARRSFAPAGEARAPVPDMGAPSFS
ncbi:MFS transporter [Sphingobium amiense]|uniref:MFS transporter n=1 Tax=Sphingobium amiense TaxID=135719 RepID=A0A494W532_9SPHN|nr:MFS transporter [Sphingobium amiense]BBD98426.1 MFS transporter [Sphingobium amiense]